MSVFSCAVDRESHDLPISGTGGVLIEEWRILYDTISAYNNGTHVLDVPADGVYAIDVQLKIKDIVDCTKIEIAIYRMDSPDEFWFIVDSMDIGSGVTDIQMGGMTTADMYFGDSYGIKLVLYGSGSPSCTIDGDDDYTAWSWFQLHTL